MQIARVGIEIEQPRHQFALLVVLLQIVHRRHAVRRIVGLLDIVQPDDRSVVLLDVLGGRMQYCLVGLGPALGFVKDGRLLALAVSTPQRTPLLPDVPSIAELLPTFGIDGSHAIMAPAGTPRAIRTQVSREVARILELPDVKVRLQGMGYNVSPSTPEEHDRIIRADIKSFTEIAKRIGLSDK